MYTPKVLKHFRNPRNFGKMKNPDGTGKVGNIVCGDVMWLYIKVGKNKKGAEIVKDIKFETFGCVAAIATSSNVTDLAKGQTLKKAMNIGREQVAKTLGGLPPVKMHCSVLAVDALAEAIHDYLSKNKKPIPADLLKRHKRILKEKKIVEEKYKDWIGAEEVVQKKGK
ncbi:iron-sulfur cluster assembly scaffold protein [Patescibacteria group bacterium]|nr:iron-sulfur cluster assembly scaffold protein [Patescibacteria group bacterium]MBU1890450.1 iron-sulfur cluster assembly scaffold protein [Patescibacteria group bacterium]